MIVIRRKPGESIWIGDAEVKVLSLSPSRVKLGVEAARGIPVLRSEVLASMEQNQQAALATLPSDLSSLLRSLRQPTFK